MNLVPVTELHYMVPMALESEMAEQGHYLPDITHVLQMDNGDIIGAIDASWMPCLYLWMDETRWNPLAAYRAWKLIQELWRSQGHGKMMIAIQKESPFYFWASQAGANHLAHCHILSLNISSNVRP